MKSAQLEINGDSIKETVIILNPNEVKMIHEGLKLLQKSKLKSIKIKNFVNEFELNNIFF